MPRHTLNGELQPSASGPKAKRHKAALGSSMDPSSVYGRLKGAETRGAALDALERHEGPLDRALALAAAPALAELLAADAEWTGDDLSDLLAGGHAASADPAPVPERDAEAGKHRRRGPKVTQPPVPAGTGGILQWARKVPKPD